MATPRILILTAGFGDGHNSAAGHLAEALKGRAEVQVSDPCHLGSPKVNSFLKKVYREITTYTPKLWSLIYQSTDKQDFSKPLPLLKKTEAAVGRLLQEFQPDLVVTTYPLYPYQLERHFEKGRRVPVVTVVTDSINVNAAWTRSPSDHFLVTDPATSDSVKNSGVPASKIQIIGFPVSPRFEKLPSLSSGDSTSPFRVLYFPTSRWPHVGRISRTVLDLPDYHTEITIILGRNVGRLYQRARELKKSYPDRVRLKGWTRKVPELLCSHHLVIGKAGGATVHEAIAARCPMLVHHLVPGQEEGNIQLLEKLEIGGLAPEPQAISTALQKLLANDAALWRAQKQRLAMHSRPAAAREAADFILAQLTK